MKYYFDVRYKNGTTGYFEYDELYENGWYYELYRVEGLIFKKREFINKIPKAQIKSYTTGKTRK